MEPELSEFASRLVRHVRDEAIASCDGQVRRGAVNALTRRWADALDLGGAEALAAVIPDVVDTTVFYLLQAIDAGELDLAFTTSGGVQVTLGESGELAGLYLMSDGWRTLSTERYVDDFAGDDPAFSPPER